METAEEQLDMALSKVQKYQLQPIKWKCEILNVKFFLSSNRSASISMKSTTPNFNEPISCLERRTHVSTNFWCTTPLPSTTRPLVWFTGLLNSVVPPVTLQSISKRDRIQISVL
jgi:hypothetical protein